MEDVATRHQRGDRRRAQGRHQRPAARDDDLRQRPAAEGRALERRGGRLQERRARAHPRHRRRRGRSGEQAAHGLAERTRRHPAARLQAARRQRDRGGAARPGAPAARARVGAALDQGRHRGQPHDHHQGGRRGRRVHARAHDRAGGDGDLPVPAHRLGHHHSRRHGPARAAGHRRDDVRAALQSGQSIAHGAHHRGRFRGGRCHRDAGEHLPPHRGRPLAPASHAQGRKRDRLHHHVHQHLAGRGVHSAAADGRHHRPAVPRIRHHHDADHRRLGVRRAHAVPDDVRPVPARREACPARPLLHDHRARLRQAARLVHARPRFRARAAARDAGGVRADRRHHGAAVRRHSQGVLSAAGHGNHRGPHRCAAGHLVRGNGAQEPPAAGGRGDATRTSRATAR